VAIKAGQIIHVGNDTVVIDRIQTGGPGTLNIPKEIIYELGNYQSVAQIRDIPDLTFSLESYDTSTSLEQLLLRIPAAGSGLTGAYTNALIMDPSYNKPLDMKSAFKGGLTATDPFATVNSVGLPYLSLESLSYKFGLKDDARQTASLRGDSIYYNVGSTYVEQGAGTGATGQTLATTKPAYAVTEGGVQRRVQSVLVGAKRLTYGVDYTESSGTVTAGAAIATLTFTAAIPTGELIEIMYASPTTEEFPQTVHAPASTVKPAAIRGRDIAVYLGGYDPTHPYTNRLLGVQSVQADWKVTLEKDEEFGNYHFVDQDFEVPTVSGNVEVKPTDPVALQTLLQQIAGVTDSTQAVPATNVEDLPLDIVLMSPYDGSVLKRIHVPDAQLDVPGFSAKVQQKLSVTINFASDKGIMQITGS
jgi:hypothetical protein